MGCGPSSFIRVRCSSQFSTFHSAPVPLARAFICSLSLARSLARSLLVASSFFFVHTLLPSCRAAETATASADPTAAADLTAGESAISVLWISFVWFPGFANSMLSFFFRFRGLATSMLSFSLWAHCFRFPGFCNSTFPFSLWADFFRFPGFANSTLSFLCEAIPFDFQDLLIPCFPFHFEMISSDSCLIFFSVKVTRVFFSFCSVSVRIGWGSRLHLLSQLSDVVSGRPEAFPRRRLSSQTSICAILNCKHLFTILRCGQNVCWTRL